MKRFLLLILFVTTFTFHDGAVAASAKFNSYPPELRHVISRLERLPEARELLARVNNEGDIRIRLLSSSSEFEAFWSTDTRTILLSRDSRGKTGQTISSILFELHNASTDKELSNLYDAAQRGIISKPKFVESMERIEHRNALNTTKLLAKGIQLGLFPRDAAWGVQENFSDYFRYQQRAGHSRWHARTYDNLRYTG